jgi:hypothetical protein
MGPLSDSFGKDIKRRYPGIEILVFPGVNHVFLVTTELHMLHVHEPHRTSGEQAAQSAHRQIPARVNRQNIDFVPGYHTRQPTGGNRPAVPTESVDSPKKQSGLSDMFPEHCTAPSVHDNPVSTVGHPSGESDHVHFQSAPGR